MLQTLPTRINKNWGDRFGRPNTFIVSQPDARCQLKIDPAKEFLPFARIWTCIFMEYSNLKIMKKPFII